MAESKIPAPIDRPLSRAYLREFTGWSTAYAPGLADPTTLRVMENCWITRDGALAVRPALRSVFPEGDWLTTNFNTRGLIGSVESFFLNDGTKALLFAVREQSGEVTFKVARYESNTGDYHVIELEDAGFEGDPGDMAFTQDTRYVRYLQIDNKILALPDSPNALDTVRIFFVGEEKMLVSPGQIDVPQWGSNTPGVRLPEAAWINGDQSTLPSEETPTSGTADQPLTGTLIDADSDDNIYSFAYFYTFYNDLGETMASQMTVVKTKRPWSQWQWETADTNGGPSGTGTTDPNRCCDQLVVFIADATRQAAAAQGATGCNFYMATWSDQGAVPTEGQMIATIDWREVDPLSARGRFIQHTPVAQFPDVLRTLPVEDETNYTRPSSAAQGAVAGDRVILVNDRQNPARIIWSSNQLGEYTNFSATRNGGFKTLTAGNLLVPAAVKLWQNPQSVDTLVIMCMGVDGYSTSYYMAPAEVTGLNDSTLIMGFEETTATPGTVSPWGTEVVDQALYHPLDEQLMKSTAANYRISHNTMTDPISNKWLELINKRNIVSSHLDSRIYYIVHNPDGEALEEGCMGNEIWVLDTDQDSNPWSRWLIQANSLHTLEIGGKIYMAITRPDAIFVFDEQETLDEYSESGETSYRAIPWRIETNTQGANRAHDAWSHLRQANLTTGNLLGTIRYGIRGWDLNGRRIDRSKILKSDVKLIDEDPENGVDLHARPLPWDYEDYLEINRNMKEWSFYAESVEDETGETLMSYGQLNLVQYRYAPISVNVGYGFGSVETFEYGRASALSNPATHYPNGIPAPFVEPSR